MRTERAGPGRRPAGLAALLAALALALLATAAGPAAAQPVEAPDAAGTGGGAAGTDGGLPAAGPATRPPTEVLEPRSAREAEGESAEDDRLFDDWNARTLTAERALASETLSTPGFEVLREVLVGNRSAARELAARTEEVVGPLRTQLSALGPAPEDGAGEPEAVAAEREALRARIAALDARVRKADLVRARVDEAIEEIDELIRERFADQLTSRGPSPLNPALWPTALEEMVDLGDRLRREVLFALGDAARSRARADALPLIVAALAAAPLLVIFARRAAVRMIRNRVGPQAGRATRVAASALAATVRAAMLAGGLAMLLIGLRTADLTGPLGAPMLDMLAAGLAGLLCARALSLAYWSPDAPELRISTVNDAKARSASKMATVLGLVFLAETVLVVEADSAGLSPGTLGVMNALVVAPGAAALWRVARYIRPPPPPAAAEGENTPAGGEAAADGEVTAGLLFRRVAGAAATALRAAAVVSLVLALAGYFAASRFVFIPTVLTLGLIGLGVILFTLINEAVEAYLEGAVSGREGLRLLPVFFGLVVTLLSLPVLALIWGARAADLAEAWNVIVEGVEVGGVRLSPVNLLTFVVVFGIGYMLTRLLQAVLSTSVLPKTRLDSGGRTALTAGLGYLGVGLAGVTAVSMAGIDLSNLAIVAGALSVGIGFGLQTIVNNFVSGIILLVERPIKVGDWIEVDGVHGTVRRVNVRATQIETFDRSALILPNSALISGTVTNYTHGNRLGRLIIPVGVAYGSDVRQVETILKEIARAETRVLSYPPAQILFTRFGADSLDFELRVVLRDVSNILYVRSDLHFEIDRRFREAGIEIPFAQRVLHIQGAEGPLRIVPDAEDPAPAPANGADNA